MTIRKIILDYARYNHWANQKLSDWLVGLDRYILYMQTRSSFGSVELTIQHMQESQQHWLRILGSKELALPDDKDPAATSVSLLLEGSELMVVTVDMYTENDLLKKIPSTDMVQSRYEFILHVINHNSYHRGQIVTMCRQLGIVDNIPAMDYEVFLWELQKG